MVRSGTKVPGKYGSLEHQWPNEYRIWVGMRQRCFNPKCREYRHYGGRGITVCRRWQGKGGFARFLADMGPQPYKRASLHRKSNHGDYEPANVVWANARTQARNRRNNRLLTYDDRTMTVAEWAEALDMKPGTLLARLRKGWSVERALTEPVRARRPYSAWVRRNPIPRKRGPKPRQGPGGSSGLPGLPPRSGSANNGLTSSPPTPVAGNTNLPGPPPSPGTRNDGLLGLPPAP